MAIVTLDYYRNCYLGEPIAEADFPRAEAKAERIIAQITHGRAANYAALPAWQQEAVREAVCAQVEYYAIYGTDVAVAGRQAGGFTVGKVRVDGAGASVALGASSMVCPGAYAALEQTGLLNPQVATCGDMGVLPYPWGWL